MKEWWNKYVKSSWIGLVAGIVIIALLLKIFALPAVVPFGVIFTWVAFFVGIPILWKKYGGQGIAEFWVNPLRKGLKIALCLFVFLLIRAYFTEVVKFTLFESYVNFTQTTGAITIFGYTSNRLLFEATFLFLIGTLTLNAIFLKKKKARVIVVGFLTICFLLQTFVFGTGNVAQVAKQPLYEETVAAAVKKSGAIGGIAKQLWVAGFGKSEKIASADLATPVFKNYGFGIHTVVVEAGEGSSWIKIPPNARWDISPINGRKNWVLVPYGGKVISFKKDKIDYVDYSDQNMIFSVVNKEKEEVITFRLEITPRT